MDAETLVGQQIGQYRIKKHIARGGMADVYLAEDVDLQRPAAIKVMLAALAADAEFVQRFQREARTVAQLNHPNIVQVYNIGMTPENRPYIAMQYIEGQSLRERLRQLGQQGKLMPTAQVLSIVRQVADALRAAHHAGIVHRDIKPNNILIRDDGTPVLVDLGIAAVQSGPKLTRTGSLIGTPHYMSPEQAQGQHADERSDIYALGVVLYEMLTTQPPFVADEPMAVLHKQVYEQPTPIGRLRPDLAARTQQIVEFCLQKDPNNRLQTAAEMVTFLDQALADEGGGGYESSSGVWRPQPTSVTPISQNRVLSAPPAVEAAMPEQPPGKRRGWLWLLPLLLLVLGGGGWLLWSALDRGDEGGVIELPEHNGGTAEGVAEVAVATATAVSPAVIPADATSTVAPTITPLPTLTPLPSATATLEPTVTAVPSPTPTAGPTSLIVGYSVNNRPIEAVRFGSGSQVVLFIGGLHAGFAPATVSLANRAITHFTVTPEDVPQGVTLYIIRNASPDSPNVTGELEGRLNANGVDLNRNWDCRWEADAKFRGVVVPDSGGPRPFSEPETAALRDFILEIDPVAVVFWEARATDGLSSPGACGTRSLVSAPLSQVYGVAAGYQIGDFENLTNQEINGDGTNWLDDQGIPAIAVLLPEYAEEDWFNNLEGIRAVLARYAR
ncbi:MAG: protein kinase [Anaerolineales bacterium]|nr:protein kinase [Anaerolineales bacterium]